MIKDLKKIILDRWNEIAPDQKQPADLSFMISGRGRYDTRYAKSVIMFYHPDNGRLIAVAKTTNDPKYGSLVERAFRNIERVRSGSYPDNVKNALPRPITIEHIGKDTVSILTAVNGKEIYKDYIKGGADPSAFPNIYSITLNWLNEMAVAGLRRDESAIKVVRDMFDEFIKNYIDLHKPDKQEKQLVESSWSYVSSKIGNEIPIVPIHGDYWVGNIFKDNEHVTGVIDWEYAREYSLPLFDWIQFHFSMGIGLLSEFNFGRVFEEAFFKESGLAKEFINTLQDYFNAYGMKCSPELIESLFVLYIVETSVREYDLFRNSYYIDKLRHANMGILLANKSNAIWKTML